VRRIEVTDRSRREALVEGFFAGTGRTYDQVVAVTTLGLDGYWKRRLLAHVPAGARSILDLACGTGIVTRRLHERAPQARIVGVDLTEDYLAVARQSFADVDADVTFLHANAEIVDLDGTFDVVVSSYIPKYVDADALIGRFDPHLEPGGIVALHDFDYPSGWIPRAVWRAHMQLVRVVGCRLVPSWKQCLDANLESLIRDAHWVSIYLDAFARFGYEDVRHEKLSFRTAGIVSARKPR